MFIKITRKIVMFIPVHNDNTPYYAIIRLNASNVFLYWTCYFLLLFSFVILLRFKFIPACFLTNATSNGFPTKAPNTPLIVAIIIFYSLFIYLLCYLQYCIVKL